MTTPSELVDVDLSPWSNDHYYAVERASIWRTTDLTESGAATWEEVFSESDFDGGDNLQFLRIKCANKITGLVFALGYCENPDDSAYADCYCFRSSNHGLSWTYHLVREQFATMKDYTVSLRRKKHTKPPGQTYPADTYIANIKRFDGTETYNPWAAAYTYWANQGGSGPTWWHGTIGWKSAASPANTNIPDTISSSSGTQTPVGAINSLLSAPQEVEADGWLDEYFGTWQLHASSPTPMTKNSNRVNMGFQFGGEGYGYPGHSQSEEMIWWVTGYAFFKYPSVTASAAFDIAPSNNDWLYIGMLDKIYQSEDSGFTWEEWASIGAHDLAVFRLAAGALYIWDTSGNLKIVVDGTTIATILSATAINLHGRIALDPPAGVYLWVLEYDGSDLFDLKRRYTGSWVEQESDIRYGRGLEVREGGKILYLSEEQIRYSSNYGTSFANKKGGWSGFRWPLKAQLMAD